MRGFAVVLMLGMLTGCIHSTTTTTPPATIAPGYLNQTDQEMGEALAAAHQFYVQIQSDIASGKYAPSAAEKTTLNNFGIAINVAQTAYLAYHANPNVTTESTASSAVQKVETQQNQLQPSIPGVS